MPVLSNAEGNPSAFNNNRPRSRRGGRRPGAGAPPGNLNALKHGRRSAQFAQLGALLATLPEARQALLALARRHRLKQRRAEDVAALLLQRLLNRAHQMSAAHPVRFADSGAPPGEPVEGSNVQSPIHERRTIKQTAPSPRNAQYDSPTQTKKHTPAQSNPQPTATPSIDPQIGKTV